MRLKFDSDVTVLATGVKADSLAKDLRAVGINRVSTYEPIRAKLVNGFGTYTTRLDPDTVFTFESNPADGTVMSLPIDGDNVLTVTEDIKSLVIAARPRGANCFWQTWYLAATTPMKFRGPTVSNVADAVETSAITPTESGNLIDAMLETVNVIPSGRDNLSVSRGSWNKKVILKVKSGIPASADINWGDIQPVLSSGLVTITNNKIAVAAGAKATDSIRSQYLDVIIEE